MYPTKSLNIWENKFYNWLKLYNEETENVDIVDVNEDINMDANTSMNKDLDIVDLDTNSDSEQNEQVIL